MILRNLFVRPHYPENLERLYQLAYNLWWSWNYEAINLFYSIDTQLFRETGRNPVRLLCSLSKERIHELSRDRGFLFELEKVWNHFEEYMQYVGSFTRADGSEAPFGEKETIAFFMMECGIHTSIPIYAGGLGILSGDFLKSASDMGLPLTGVGLLYKYGYFTQRINMNGYQEEVYQEFEKQMTPIKEVRGPDGHPAYVAVRMLDDAVKVKLWQLDVGKSTLILLDTDLLDNPPSLRSITHELYVADREKRLQQELVLGLGGLRALDYIGKTPSIFHLNEGHSAFLLIGRLQKLMGEMELPFFKARAMIRASTVFTTHTPVIAGNESFPSDLVRKYLELELKSIGLSFDDLVSLASVEGKKDVFWLPALAIHFARYVNGVSRQHGEVSRRMWAGLFPERHPGEIPIDSVTNGVHISWISEPFTYILNRYIGPDYIHRGEREEIWTGIAEIGDDEIWEAHRKNKLSFVSFIRKKLADEITARGYSPGRVLKMTRPLNPEYLTVAFARRFATYKRPTLILKDKERLKRILTNPKKPVQLVFAGKAHPADGVGKNMIREVIEFARSYEVEDRVVFLENYDIHLARHLVWGVDVWLNTPVRDMEASGTSGMKAAMNGVLNLSTPEGWWLEGYNGANGWSLNAGQYYGHSDLQEAAEANQIYDLLEHEVTDAFYERNEAGIPEQWVKMMKESLSSVCQRFSMNRVLANYLSHLYMPALYQCSRINADNRKLLSVAQEEAALLQRHWKAISITKFEFARDVSNLVEGEAIPVDCVVHYGDAPHELCKLELFCARGQPAEIRTVPLEFVRRDGPTALYSGVFTAESCGVQGVNVRIRPANDIVADMHPEMIKWRD
jgi:glycogen phosphorylase